MPCTNRNKANITNHCFVNYKNFMTKNTATNEYRHANFKHGKDRVEPNFNMAQSAHKMSEKANKKL